MDELDLPRLLEVYSHVNAAVNALRLEDARTLRKTVLPAAEDLREDVRSLRAKCRELADTIDARNAMIFDITGRNNELLKSINEYRKSSALKIAPAELLGKRQASSHKAAQSKADVSNKGVQVFRHTKGLSEEVARRRRLMQEDGRKLDEIIRCMTVDDK